MMLLKLTATLAVFALGGGIFLRCLAAWGVKIPAFGGIAPALPSPQTTTTNERRVFLYALALRAGVFLAAAACVCLHSGVSSLEALLQHITRWDSTHYVKLAELGYANYIENGQHLFLVFYPLYVWLTRAVRLLIPNTILAGMAVSWLCFAGGCSYVYRLAARLFGHNVAKNALLLLSFFPFSFFFGTVMTESLFLLTTAAACCYALEHKWLPFALWGALAAMTRMTGVLVLVPAGYELLRCSGLPEKPCLQRFAVFLKKLPLLFAPLLGTGVYLLLNWHVDGDPFAFVRHQEHWHQGGMWIADVLAYLTEYALNNLGQPIGWAIWLPEVLLFVVCFAVLAAAVWKNLHPGLVAFGFCYLIANYSLSWLLSAGRYLSCGFMLFILAAALLEKHPHLRTAVLGAEAVGLGVYLFAWLAGAQIM